MQREGADSEDELLDEEAQNIDSAAHADSSKKLYLASIRRFLTWAQTRTNKEFLHPAYHDVDVSKISTVEALKSRDFPLTSEFNVTIYKRYLTSLKKKAKPGEAAMPLESGTLNGHRSALRFLFTTFNQNFSTDFVGQMAIYMKGSKRKTAKQKGKGKGDVQVGKRPMSYELYRATGLRLLQSSSNSAIFAHAYITTSWNLMCRAGNTASICFSHLEWIGDSLGIYFAHMKNDQEGERPREPRHIYANPLHPEVCAILSLALYLLCNQYDASDHHLFPGSNQYDRYHKALKTVFEGELAPALQKLGLTAKKLGTHSTRKGAATYASMGTTAAPSAAAVHFRAGWKANHVSDRYIQYEAAGDQHVGRVVAGLPVNDPRFGILPPHFSERSFSDLDSVIAECFPNVPLNVIPICHFCVASVVYHSAFLRRTLPTNHPLFSTSLFGNQARFGRLQERVICRLGTPEDTIFATGQSPYAILMQQVASGATEIKTIVPAVLKGVEEILEKRAFDAGQLSRSSLESILQEKVAPILARLMRFDGSMPPQEKAPEEHRQLYVYPLTWSSFSHNFFSPYQLGLRQELHSKWEMPSVSLEVAFRIWCCPRGNDPPLSCALLNPKVHSVALRKRFSEYKCLMQSLEAQLKEKKKWINSPTEEQAIEMFKLLPNTDNGRKRPNQIKFTAGLRGNRRTKKQKQQQIADADTEDV